MEILFIQGIGAMILNIKDATQLYQILAPHLPEDKPEDALDYIDAIVNSIIEQERYPDFVNVLILTQGKTVEELEKLLPQEVLALFVRGLEENKIVLLQDFMQKVGFNANN